MYLTTNRTARSRASAPWPGSSAAVPRAGRGIGAALGLACALLAIGSAGAQPATLPRSELGSGGGRYGTAVSWSGDVAVVGALAEGGDYVGAAYVYHRDHAGWHLGGILTPHATSDHSFFGASVAVSDNDLAIGAWGSDVVELYSRGASGWTRTGELRPTDANASHFGCNIALQGDVLAIAAEHAGGEPGRPGAVHLYRRVSGAWHETAVLAPSGLTSGALFGSSLALAGDVLAVGAMHDEPGADSSGAVYLYQVGANGARLAQRIAPPAGANAHYFGSTVVITGDTLAVSAPGGDYGDYRSGPVFVYRLRNGTWTYLTQLGPVGGADQRFGIDLAITSTGVAVAVATDNSAAGGSVSVLLYPYPEGQDVDAPELLFATEAPQVRYVALATDGQQLLVGAATGPAGRGSVYTLDSHGAHR